MIVRDHNAPDNGLVSLVVFIGDSEAAPGRPYGQDRRSNDRPLSLLTLRTLHQHLDKNGRLGLIP